MNRQRGFTLSELMVAMALGLIILGVVGYAFSNTSKATARGLGAIDAHQKMRVALGLIERDLQAMVPACAMNLENTGVGGTTPGKLTFLTTLPRLDDDNDVGTAARTDDLKWVVYEWSNAASEKSQWVLMRGELPTGTAPDAATAQSVTGHTMLEGITHWQITAQRAHTSDDATVFTGFGPDGTGGTPADRPATIKIEMAVLVETGQAGDIASTVEHTIYLPGAPR